MTARVLTHICLLLSFIWPWNLGHLRREWAGNLCVHCVVLVWVPGARLVVYLFLLWFLDMLFCLPVRVEITWRYLQVRRIPIKLQIESLQVSWALCDHLFLLTWNRIIWRNFTVCLEVLQVMFVAVDVFETILALCRIPMAFISVRIFFAINVVVHAIDCNIHDIELVFKFLKIVLIDTFVFVMWFCYVLLLWPLDRFMILAFLHARIFEFFLVFG